MTYVGKLLFTSSAERHGEPRAVPIYATTELDIGRKLVHDLLGFTDHAISNHHLQIRCNIYDDGDASIAPAIYLKVLSGSCNVVVTDGTGGRAILTNHHPARLLDDGDMIRLSRQVSIVYRALNMDHHLHQRNECRVLQSSTDRYHVTNHTLGKGANGNVVLAIRRKDQRQFICKTVIVDETGDNAEATTLAMISHPNIVSTHALFRDQSEVRIIQELATGGDLYSYLQLRHGLDESEIVVIAYQLTQAVRYLHSSGVVHRDIKPENILLTSQGKTVRIVLTDFGQARVLERSTSPLSTNQIMRMSTRVGTVGWIAPELQVSELAYGPAIDMWGLGSVVLSAFTMRMPELESQVSSLEFDEAYKLTAACACGASESAIAFLRGCLMINEELRLTAADAVMHPWFLDEAYAVDLLAVYEKAISSWRPIRPPCIQDVEASMPVQSLQGLRSDLPLNDMTEREMSNQSSSSEMPSSSQHYVTQATLPIEDERSCETSLEAFRPPRSTQVTSLTFSQVPSYLLESCASTAASEE